MRRLLVAGLCASVLSSSALAHGGAADRVRRPPRRGRRRATPTSSSRRASSSASAPASSAPRSYSAVRRLARRRGEGPAFHHPRARDGAGADLDVRVTVDGAPLATRLDGQAIPMNPGMHAFHFQLADGASADARVVVAEGSQNQLVTTTLGGLAPQLPATPAQSTATVPAAPGGASPWRTVGWVLSGVGVVGLGVGAGFGIAAMSDKGSANCARQALRRSAARQRAQCSHRRQRRPGRGRRPRRGRGGARPVLAGIEERGGDRDPRGPRGRSERWWSRRRRGLVMRGRVGSGALVARLGIAFAVASLALAGCDLVLELGDLEPRGADSGSGSDGTTGDGTGGGGDATSGGRRLD